MTIINGQPRKVAAIIIVYHPNLEALQRLVSVLARDRICIIIADNGGASAALGRHVGTEGITIIDLGGNQGIGAAINAGIKQARNVSAEYVITFDQDSDPSPGMVGLLVEAFERQAKLGIPVAAVGPQLVDRRQAPVLVHPFVRLGIFGAGRRYGVDGGDLVTVDALITSGCLTSIDVLDAVGLMDPGYFVDYTDYEWSFRARSRGFLLFGVCKAKMSHELGHGRMRKIIGITLIEYSAVRRYYYARNTISVSALKCTSFRWKSRLMAGLVLRFFTLFWAPRSDGDAVWAEYKMFLRGLLDGLLGVRGQLKVSRR
jgi:rhamnosyltransferase